MIELDGNIRAKVLGEALPFIRSYRGKVVVVKAGGQVLVNQELLTSFARDVSLLSMVGVNIVVVHGGGPQIGQRLAEAGIAEKKIDGLRVTDEKTMAIVDSVLCDEINTNLVTAINDAGASACKLRGAENGLLQAERKQGEYGLVGDISVVDASAISSALPNCVPVIAPVGISNKGELLNINADVAAAAVAAALKAYALFILTDTDGVLDKKGNVQSRLSAGEIVAMKDDGSITAGMLPKVECAIVAIANGVVSCRILNGTSSHPLLLEMLTDAGVGTMIVNEKD